MLSSAKWTLSTPYFPQNYFNIASYYTHISSLEVYCTKLYSCPTSPCMLNALSMLSFNLRCSLWFSSVSPVNAKAVPSTKPDYILPNPKPFTKYDKSHSVYIWITLLDSTAWNYNTSQAQLQITRKKNRSLS